MTDRLQADGATITTVGSQLTTASTFMPTVVADEAGDCGCDTVAEAVRSFALRMSFELRDTQIAVAGLGTAASTTVEELEAADSRLAHGAGANR